MSHPDQFEIERLKSSLQLYQFEDSLTKQRERLIDSIYALDKGGRLNDSNQ